MPNESLFYLIFGVAILLSAPLVLYGVIRWLKKVGLTLASGAALVVVGTFIFYSVKVGFDVAFAGYAMRTGLQGYQIDFGVGRTFVLIPIMLAAIIAMELIKQRKP